MNILALSDLVYPDAAGGAQTVAWELTRQLVSKHKFSFVSTAVRDNAVEKTVEDGITIHRLKKSLSPLGLARVRKHLVSTLFNGSQIDVLHSHFAYAETGLGSLRIPRVRSFHGPWHEEGLMQEWGETASMKLRSYLKYWVRKNIEKRSLLKADKVPYLSRYSKGKLLSLGIEEQKLRYAPGGTDTARFYPDGSKDEARKRIGIDHVGPLLVSVRRLVPRMGLKALVEAFNLMSANHKDLKLIIGGRGPQRDELQARIRELQLEDRISLVGFIADEELADYYRAADLFILPTRDLEGFGLVTVDALSCGTPVLGTPVGATPELLAPLDTRLVLNGIEPLDIANGIKSYLMQDWKCRLSQEFLYSYVKANYTWERHADAIDNVYREVAANRKRR